MTKFTRQPDGSYAGTYKGHAFTVRKEMVEERTESGFLYGTRTIWVARSGTFEHRSTFQPTRADAVIGLCRDIDMAEVAVPEIDALLKRWAEAIKVVVPSLPKGDVSLRVELELLRTQMSWMEMEVRNAAVRFEEKLASLKARAQQQPEPPAIGADD